jgi:hypothetical protein
MGERKAVSIRRIQEILTTIRDDTYSQTGPVLKELCDSTVTKLDRRISLAMEKCPKNKGTLAKLSESVLIPESKYPYFTRDARHGRSAGIRFEGQR